MFRDRLNKNKVNDFLEFFCQDDYLQDVAYGNKTIRITKTISFKIPAVVRKATNTKIIDDYKSFYGEDNSLSVSTCHRILNECIASKLRFLQGLDNMMADGLNAFESSEKILESLYHIKFSLVFAAIIAIIT